MKKLIPYIILISYFISIFPIQAVAQTASSIRQQIEDTNAQIEALNKEIAQYQSQISETNAQSNTLSSLIKELTLTRSKLIKEKEQIEKNITATGMVIKSLSSNIEDKEDSIYISKKTLGKAIKDLNQNDNLLIIERLLSVNNFKDFSREYNNLLSVNEKVRQNIIDISLQKEELLSSKSKKESEQTNLNTLKKNLIQKEQVVLITKKEKDALLNQTKNKEAEYKKLLLERQKKRDEFEKQLASYEDQLKFILNPKLLPKEGSEALSWPLNNVFITQLFGITSASKRLYKSGSHSGVDFRASIGTEVKSMENGIIMGTGDTDIYCKGASFGKWVLIKYNNGLSSTFGHLSVINVNKGDKVKKGDIVAFSGNTGHSTGPHLHVTVYASDGVKVDNVPSLSCNGKTFIMPIAASSAYLDPMLYLPKVTPLMIKK
jgi:murein DD-endopeptidase MepM/ murein hydrolase activator NlpD